MIDYRSMSANRAHRRRLNIEQQAKNADEYMKVVKSQIELGDVSLVV